MITAIAIAFAALFGGCWILEISIHNKSVAWYRTQVKAARAEGWEEGRQYELARRNAQHPRSRGQFSERTKP